MKRDKMDADLNLIEIVRQYPQLYDKSHLNYRNQVRKTEVWELIALRLNIKDGATAASRWKTMRQAYLASKRPRKTGDEGGNVYTYIYADELSFLIPSLEKLEGPSLFVDKKNEENLQYKYEERMDEDYAKLQESDPVDIMKLFDILNKVEDDSDHFAKIVSNFLRKLEPKKQRIARIKFEQLMLELEE